MRPQVAVGKLPGKVLLASRAKASLVVSQNEESPTVMPAALLLFLGRGRAVVQLAANSEVGGGANLGDLFVVVLGSAANAGKMAKRLSRDGCGQSLLGLRSSRTVIGGVEVRTHLANSAQEVLDRQKDRAAVETGDSESGGNPGRGTEPEPTGLTVPVERLSFG